MELVVGVAAFLAGAIPFSNLFARRLRRVDLREVETGTVSGTALYRVAGFGPLAIAGILDIAKGSVGPALAQATGDNRALLAAAAAGLAVAGHNWSPFLRGAGGRGISPAIGALLVVAWPGVVLLFAVLAIGRILRNTGLAVFLGLLGLPLLLAVTHGSAGAAAGGFVVVPMLLKRVLGNRPAGPGARRVYVHRLLFDRDGPA